MATDNTGRETLDLTEIEGVGSWTADSLREAGFESVEEIRETSTDELAEAEGIGEKRAAEITEHADELTDEATAEADESEDPAEATATTDGGKTAGEQVGSREAKAEEDEAEAEEAKAEEAEAEEDEAEEEGPEIETERDDINLNQIRDAARDVAETHIEEPYEGVIEIDRDDDGWYAVVEVVERSAVPDTQDILGQYEIGLDTSGSVQSYRLVDRYRRGTVSGTQRG